jgi:hypothetical protein
LVNKSRKLCRARDKRSAADTPCHMHVNSQNRQKPTTVPECYLQNSVSHDQHCKANSRMITSCWGSCSNQALPAQCAHPNHPKIQLRHVSAAGPKHIPSWVHGAAAACLQANAALQNCNQTCYTQPASTRAADPENKKRLQRMLKPPNICSKLNSARPATALSTATPPAAAAPSC